MANILRNLSAGVALAAGFAFGAVGAETDSTSPSETGVKKAEPSASTTAPEGEEVSIGVNPRASPIWQERIAFYNQAVEISSLFAEAYDPKDSASAMKERARQDTLTSFLNQNKPRAIEGLLSCLDSRSTKNKRTRVGALRALESSKFVHPTVSAYLAASAVGDPEGDVRKQAVSTVKARSDDPAIGGMIQYLMSSFDNAGNVLNQNIRDNAVDALRDINDKRVYQAMMYYVTMELRVTNTELNNFATRQIDSFSVNNGANVSVLVPLSFPIQFPELKITRVRTTVKCPAASGLEALSGQAFGEDLDRWAKWLAGKK